ncbi:MAG: hypothetical protein QM808_11620 [Steroidobacteraceae bacterium]
MDTSATETYVEKKQIGKFARGCAYVGFLFGATFAAIGLVCLLSDVRDSHALVSDAFGCVACSFLARYFWYIHRHGRLPGGRVITDLLHKETRT